MTNPSVQKVTSEFRKKRAVLYELWKQSELVNLTLVSKDERRFPVHAELMVVASPFVDRQIQKIPCEDIKVCSVSQNVLKDVIQYIYTGELHVKEDKLLELACAADALEMPDIAILCQKYLESRIDNINCVGIYRFAKYFFYSPLLQKATEFILVNFAKLQEINSEFRDLYFEDIVAFLNADNLNVKQEDLVYWAAMKWLETDMRSRLFHFPSLLRCVRMGLCSSEFLERHVWSNPLMSGSEECEVIQSIVAQIFADLQTDPTQMIFELTNPFLRPRIPQQIIFITGGWSAGSATNVLETYDYFTKRWFLSLREDSSPRAYHGMTWHGGYLYVVGGFDGNEYFSSVRRMNPESGEWEECACMYSARCYVSVCGLEEFVYAMGGHSGHRRNKSAERYEPSTNQWSRIRSMQQVRSDASADVLYGKIYIVGGFNGAHVLDSAECYNPVTDEWNTITAMTSPRSGVRLAAHGRHLYAIGGFNGANRLATVERYDSESRAWSLVSSMTGPRSNFAVAVLGGLIYVLGGFDGAGTISNADVYDPRSNTWHAINELNMNRSALCACVVYDISNARDYTFLGSMEPQLC